MSELKHELGELMRVTGAYLESLRDSGIDEVGWDPAVVRAHASALVQAPVRARAPASAHVQAPVREAAPAHAPAPALADPRPKLSSEERRGRLAVLAEEVASCTRCRLHETRNKTAFARGNPDSELVFIGEGPGTQEDLQGEPFVGPAGQLLDKMISAMGYARDDVYIMNAVKCRPSEPNDPKKDRKPDPAEMAACRPFFERQLELVEPKVMVALGATAMQAITGATVGISRMRGTWRLYKGRTPLMPTFHPAYLLREPDKKREVWDDLKQVMQRLGKALPPKG